jgi:hypothetical protein
MNTRKSRLRLVTIPEFTKARPDITENKIRFALRNRYTNGFANCVYFTRAGHRKVMLDVERTCRVFRRRGARMTLVVSFGQHRADVKPARFGATLGELHAWLRDDPRFAPRLGEKDGPYLSFADYGEGGTRDYDHLLASYGVPLDLDLGQYAWGADDIRARLDGFRVHRVD